MMSPVPRDSEKNMDFWYSSEKWKDILGADEAETICVPPCLDVLKTWKRNDLDEAPNLAPNILGQKGEAAFMQKFKELSIGGILVSGLRTRDLVAGHTVRNNVVKHGEWDAIFFHQNRGIFVIEVKATEMNDESIVNKRMEKAKTQLDRNIKNIQQSFLSLYQKECTCITGFICFPFRKEDRKIYEGYKVIDKSALNDQAIFRKFFETARNETMTEVSLLRSFVAEFVCCRSQVEFHSQAYNAMQVATWIMEQNIAQKQDPTKVVNMPGNGPSGNITLTAQQLEIVESREKCIIIYGAPGSGKTLILMLRALKAAMEKKAGSVFVFVNEKLKAKYEQYFFEERAKIFVDDANNIDRTPNVQTIDKINFAKPEDDVFFDETPVEDFHIEKVESRVNCSGSTTVVFTGLHKPGEAVASFRLYRPRLKEFKHFELKKVLRGTGNIFGEWGHYYPHGITIGHSIYGGAVKSYSFDRLEQVQNEIANKIATLTSANINNIDMPSLKKEHIAVITCDDNDSNEMRNYLDTRDIRCGEVSEQARRLKSTSIVAVDAYLNTPSYEWPIVFIVLKPGVTKKEVLPIAASRCIASLTIIIYKKATTPSIRADAREPMEEEIFEQPNLASPTSSFCLSQSNAEDWQQKLENAQQSLKEMYLTRFLKIYPFSLPFTFDIENTWVSLALKDDIKNTRTTEDHSKLLKTAFEKAKMLIIEGNPATGKTSLMRRLAYEWARQKEYEGKKICINSSIVTLGKRSMHSVRRVHIKRARLTDKWAKEMQELLRYDLVIYAEFREVREKKFESVRKLVLSYSKNYLNQEVYENLKRMINDEQFCKENKILLLLDGYDESSLDEQCLELKSYLFGATVDNALNFHVVITTRKGYLSNLHGLKGRFVFAEVLGFPTKKQKEKYISKHFLLTETAYKDNIAAVHQLLGKNKNLNKIAATPLFLTFICLVHEKIIDGSLVELYCNIIWWLIDRYQKSYPECNIPTLFGFPNKSRHKFKTIQDHYLHFPQLHRLGEMALHNLEKDDFNYFDYQQYNLQPIIEQIGLLRKEEKHDESYKLITSYFFPHRTIQEFLAAFYYFYSDDQKISVIKEPLMPTYSKLLMNKMNEFQMFLLRISLSDKIPKNLDKRKIYFESLNDLRIDIAFDAFNTTTGFNNQLLNCLISHCINMKNVNIHGKINKAEMEKTSNILSSTSKQNQKSNTTPVSGPIQPSFQNFASLLSSTFQNCIFNANSQLTFINCPSLKTVKFIECGTKSGIISFAEVLALDTVEFEKCIFEANCQLSFTNCPSLKNLQFKICGISRSTNLNIATLPAIETLSLEKCTFADNAQLSFTNCHSLKNLRFNGCEIKSDAKFGITTLPATDIVEFVLCTFESNSQLSFTTCPSLKSLKLEYCAIESSTIIGIATLPAIDTVEFCGCTTDLATWQSITDEISNSSIKCLKLSADYFVKDIYSKFLHHLQACERIQQIHVKDVRDSNGWILNRYEEVVTAKLIQAVQKLPGLMSITIIILDYRFGKRLERQNQERIEKAGQERNPNFLIKYVE